MSSSPDRQVEDRNYREPRTYERICLQDDAAEDLPGYCCTKGQLLIKECSGSRRAGEEEGAL